MLLNVSYLIALRHIIDVPAKHPVGSRVCAACVSADDDGVWYCASNGAALAVFHEPPTGEVLPSIVIGVDALFALKKALSSRKRVSVTVADDHIMFDEAKIVPFDDKFPDWRRLCANLALEREMPAHYDPMLLYDLARTVAEGLGKSIIVHQRGPQKPAIIFADSSDAFIGLVMPMANLPSCNLPAWVPVRRKRERANETL